MEDLKFQSENKMNAGGSNEWSNLHDLGEEAMGLVLQMQAKLAAADADTKRLDWLEEHPVSGEPIIVFHPPSDHITWRVDSDKEFDNLRAAIDAAKTGVKA